MCNFKLLLVEDDASDLQVYEDTIRVYNKKEEKDINYVVAKNIEEANAKLDNSFDGAIIDLNLQSKKGAGNEVIKEIAKKYRIPIVIFTGNPAEIDESLSESFISVYIKGSVLLDKVLDDFFKVFDTGITKIMGGRGIIEKGMNKIFWNNIHPKVKVWEKYAEADKKATEGALLRYIISHLQELLDNEYYKYFCEEMYIDPPLNEHIATGNIIKSKETEDSYIILSPACDLVVYNGKLKTDNILLCLIEKHSNELIKNAIKNLNDKDKSKKQRAEKFFDELPKNSYSGYYHYLPQINNFEGGIINFRKIITVKPKEIKRKFNEPTVKISAPFIKDIIARFSAYYARQGQPDFNFEELTKNLIKTAQK